MRCAIAAFAAALWLLAAASGKAQGSGEVTGQIESGVWVDSDGCMHWWADGGTESYLVPRRNPANGKPVCLQQTSCLAKIMDAMFATASANLTVAAEAIFRPDRVVFYIIAGQTDIASPTPIT